MLTIGKLYPEDAYYTEHGAVQGQYIGEGPTLLGLTDPERDLPALRKGQHPDGSSLVGESPKDHREGFDATFNAPKSVSVLALVAGDERLLAAHREAVREAYRFLEAHAATARVTVDGETRYVKTGNLTGIEFEHTAARPVDGARDPHLHTHIPTINSTQRPDGERRALENRPILDNIKVYGAVYLGVLRRAVEALGYATVRDGDSFRILGVTLNVVTHFSPRHADIKRTQATHPGMSATKAAIYTREPKSHEIDPAGREQRWRDDLQALGYTPESLLEAARREGEQARSRADGPQPAPVHVPQAAPDPQTGREVQAIISALERDTSWWKADEMWRAAVPYLAERLSHQEFARQIEGAVRSGDLIPLDNGRYTSPDALRTEQAIVGHVTNTRAHADQPPAHTAADATAIADRWTARNPGQTPTGEQVAAVGFLVRAQDPVVALHGPPGTGKTSVLGVAHDLWREQGHTVTGLAQVKQVAETLQSRTDIPSQTIEGYLQQTRSTTSDSTGKQILVIDEAATVGSRNMLDLLKAAAQNHVEKIVLVGDTRQLEPIGAGKPFEDLLSRGLIPAADLTQVQRQHEGTLREAVNALYNKDAPRAVELLDTIGAIREQAEKNAFGKPDIPVEAMARDFAVLDPERRADTLVQLPTHRHRDAFTDAAREHLKARGEIDATSERTYQVWRPLNLSHAEKLDPARYPEGGIAEFFRAKPDQQIPQGAGGVIEGVTADHKLDLRFPADGDRRLTFDPASHWKFTVHDPRELQVAVGDTLVLGKNDRELGVTNGTRGQVVALDEMSLTVKLDRADRLVTVDPRQYPYLDHGFASTIHKSQGQTVPRVMVGIDPEDRHETANRAYTAITRASEDVSIYTPDKRGLVQSMSEWAVHRSVMGVALGEPGQQDRGSSPPSPGPQASKDGSGQAPGPSPELAKSTATDKQAGAEQPGPNRVTAEVFRYETDSAIVLLPPGTSVDSLKQEVRASLVTRVSPGDRGEDGKGSSSEVIQRPFKYETKSLSRVVPTGTSVDRLLEEVTRSVRTTEKTPEQPSQEKRSEQRTEKASPPQTGAGESPKTPAKPGEEHPLHAPESRSGSRSDKKSGSPPEGRQFESSMSGDQERQDREKGAAGQRTNQDQKAPGGGDHSKPVGEVHRPPAHDGGAGSHGPSGPRGGPGSSERREPGNITRREEPDHRPLNRMGRILYGPDRLRETFGPKGWKATAVQPNQLMAKAKYILQAPTFSEGLKRMTHHVHAVRFQQTWTGRNEAIRKASGTWGTFKAAFAPTAKTVYFVSEPFRGLRHAGRIADAPTIGSAVRRVFEQTERIYDPKTQQFVGGVRPGGSRDREPHQVQGQRTSEERQTRGPAPTQEKPAQEKSSKEKIQRQGPGRGEGQEEERAANHEATNQGKGTQQNDRLQFQQGGSSKKSEKGKEDFGRG